jgi:hypothetical protein
LGGAERGLPTICLEAIALRHPRRRNFAAAAIFKEEENSRSRRTGTNPADSLILFFFEEL